MTSFRGRDIRCKEKKVATSFRGRDIRCKEKKVATSFNGRDISCKELRSRHHSVVATSIAKKEGRDIIQWSRHPLQKEKVATSLSGRDINCKERRSRHHLAVATSDPRDAKDKSRPNKSFCDITETTEVATKNQCRDINKKMGQLI